MIHCIGDSHTSVFSGEEVMQPIWPGKSSNLLPFFKTYRVGPFIAYNIKNKQDYIEHVINTITPNSEDKLLFCFGEIDIRAHFYKQTTIQNKLIEDIVINCVDRYLDAISYYKKFNLDIIIYGPIASFTDQRKPTSESYGDNKERNHATKLFNERLESKCHDYGFKFVTIFNDMVNQDLTTKGYLLDNWDGSHVHLHQNGLPILLKKFEMEGLIQID